MLGPSAQVSAAAEPDIRDTGTGGADSDELISGDPLGGMFGSAMAPSQGIYNGNTNAMFTTYYAGIEELSGNPASSTNVLDFSGSLVPVRFIIDTAAGGNYAGHVEQNGEIGGVPFSQEAEFQDINVVRGRVPSADDDPGDTLVAIPAIASTFTVRPIAQAELTARGVSDTSVSGDPNQGSYETDTSGAALFFIAVENLIGSQQADNFVFLDGGSLQGRVQGGDAPGDAPDALADTLDFRLYMDRLTAYLYAELDDSGAQTGVGGNVQSADADDNVVEVLAHYDGIERLAAAAADPAAGISGAHLVVTPFDPRLDTDPDVDGAQPPADRDLLINPPADGDPGDPTAESRISLPDLVNFPGPVILGGTLTPALLSADGVERAELDVVLPQAVIDAATAAREALPAGAARDRATYLAGRKVYAQRLVVAGPVGVPGHLVVTGNELLLQEDLAAGVPLVGPDDAPLLDELMEAAGGEREVALLATGNREEDSDGTGGDIEVVGSIGDEVNVYAGSGLVIANRSVDNAEALLLDFAGGELQFAVSPAFSFSSRPSILSQARGVNLSPVIEEFIRLLGLDASGFLVIFVNPAGLLTGALSVVVIDTSLFEEDLTLFGTLGEGIAKSLSQCEEEEGCVPNVTFEELEQLIERLRVRIAQLENMLQDERTQGVGTELLGVDIFFDGPTGEEQRDGGQRAELRALLARFKAELQAFLEYREEYLEYFGPGVGRVSPAPELRRFRLPSGTFRVMLSPDPATES